MTKLNYKLLIIKTAFELNYNSNNDTKTNFAFYNINFHDIMFKKKVTAKIKMILKEYFS